MPSKRPFQSAQRLVDVYKPDHGENSPALKTLIPLRGKKIFDEPKSIPTSKLPVKVKKIRVWRLIPIFVVLAIGAIGLVVYLRPQNIEQDRAVILSRASIGIEQGVESMRSLNFSEAQLRFQSLSTDFSSSANKGGPFSFWESVDKGWAAFGGIKDLLGGYAEFAGLLSDLSSSWPDFLNASSTLEPLPLLERAVKALGALESSNRTLISSLDSSSILSSGGSLFGSGYDLSKIKQFLESLVTWLKGGERNLAVVFLNTSELRPGGGFVGSYAHVNIKNGKVQRITIHDINEPDRLLEDTIIPPQQVRPIARNWRTADANWWFDFTLSAEKILQFLEKSELYKGTSTVKFDGVIGMTPQVLQSVLQVTGPVELKERGVIIDSENVIYELQRDIQDSREDGKDLPKGILGDLYEVLGKKWVTLDNSKKIDLAEDFFSWIEEKDMMFYARDASLANFLDSVQASGKVAVLQQQQPHDYLAIVNANLGGAKTDLVMTQKVVLQSQLDADGSVRNHLVLERKHNGNDSDDSWHSATNLSYIRVLTPASSELEFAEGMDRPRVSSKAYAKSYSVDEDLKNLESTYKVNEINSRITNLIESDKRGFAFWLSTPKGVISTTTLDYVHKLPSDIHPGMIYEFTFEKQSGVKGEYQFEIVAPVGYRWRENKLAVFDYESNDPPARVTFTLTLELDR